MTKAQTDVLPESMLEAMPEARPDATQGQADAAQFIELDRLSKSYGDNHVLEELSTSVARNEFVTLVGTSGCGKSTFLKILLGIETSTSGQLRIEGVPVHPEPSPDRGIVFQRYSVFPHLNVRQNVALGREFDRTRIFGRQFGAARRETLAEADHWLEAVGLIASAEKYPHELSGGMQQRLALAQALLKQPQVLLLDEPFGALDPGIRKDMYELVLRLWSGHKLTVFMVTHDLSEGFYLGTRLWVFDKIRHDPHAPQLYGSTITYDLPVHVADSERQRIADEVAEQQHEAGEVDEVGKEEHAHA